MIPPDFSVLLLAWDDADPSVAVFGGAALPLTLPLVYQLAARQPVTALYPHLPVATASGASAAAPVAAATPPAPPTPPWSGAFDATEAQPGVQLLPALPHSAPASPASPAAPAPRSRIIGLAELRPASYSASVAAPASLANDTKPAVAAALVVTVAMAQPSQWPTGDNAPAAGRAWMVPAAPYQGGTLGQALQSFGPPAIAAPPRPSAPTTVHAAVAAGPRIRPRLTPQAGDLRFDPDPELPARDEPPQETSAVEVPSFLPPENDLTPDAPLPLAPDAPIAPEVSAGAGAASAASVANVASAAAVTANAAIPDATFVSIAAPAVPAPAATLAALAAAAVAPSKVAAPVLPVRQPAPQNLGSRMIAYARQAAELLHGQADFGVLYAPSWPAWLAALEIRTRSGRPLVLYAASLASTTAPGPERGWVLEIERMALRRAALVLVPDAEMQQQLVTRHPEVLAKIQIVPAADEATLQQLLAEVALGS